MIGVVESNTDDLLGIRDRGQEANRVRGQKLARSDGRDRYACLEFVPGDDPTLLVREAATLRSWIVP